MDYQHVEGDADQPRYAGLGSHRGQIVGPGQWEAIITEDEHRRVLAQYAAKKSSGRRTPQRYLLSGLLLRCGNCGIRLYSSSRRYKHSMSRRYVCLSGPDHGGCGRLTIVADPLERLADAVLYRLGTPELADVLAGRSAQDARSLELTQALDETTEHLEERSLAYANRDISMREWMTAKTPITQRLEQIQRQLGHITRTSALTGLVGNADDLRRSWDTLTLSRQHAIIEALLDHIVIGPGSQGTQAMDPARVSAVWRP